MYFIFIYFCCYWSCKWLFSPRMIIDMGNVRLQFLPITLAQRGHAGTQLAVPSCHDRRQNSFALLSGAYVGVKTDESHPSFKFSSQNFLFSPSSAAEFFSSLRCFVSSYSFIWLFLARSSPSSLWCCISQSLNGLWYLNEYSWKHNDETRLFPVLQLQSRPLALKSWEIPLLWLCGFVLLCWEILKICR